MIRKKLQQPAIKAQFSLKLRNKYDILLDYDETDEEVVEKNGRTLRLHTKKQLKKYWGTKSKGKNY